MATKRLLVLKENDDKASEIYLNMIKGDADANNVEVCVFDDIKKITNELIVLDEVINDIEHTGVLVMQPFKNVNEAIIAKALEVATNDDSSFKIDIDNVTGLAPYEPATAEGICNHIIEKCPDRKTVIGIIGRGNVGISVLRQLTRYGYTVIEMNSKTPTSIMYELI